MRKTIGIVALAATAAACGAESASTKKGEEAPVVAAAAPPAAAEPRAPASMPERRVEGSLVVEELHRTTFKAVADGEVTLYRSGGVVSPSVGTLKVSEGDALKASEQVVVITAPLEVKAKVETALTGLIGEDGKPMGDAAIKAGATVAVVRYEGEGTCEFYHDEAFITGNCPSGDDFEGMPTSGMIRPAQYTWWILVEQGTAKGWLKVDGVSVKAELTAAP